MKIKTRDGSLRELNAEDVYKQVSDYLEKLELEDGYDEGLTEEEAEQYEHVARRRLGEVLQPLVPVVVAKGGFAAVTSEVLAFPYSTANSPVVTYDLWRCVGPDDGYYYELGKDTRAKLNRECMGGISNAITLFKRANGHFDRIIEAMASGKLTMATGDRFPVDGMGYPDLSRYVRGCHGTVQPRGERIEPWHATYPPEMSRTLGIPQTVEVGGVECGFRPYGSMTSWDKFKVIANLCESDYEGEIYHMLRGRYDRASDTVLARNRAIEGGGIASIDGRLAAFTMDDLFKSLTMESIKALPAGIEMADVCDDTGLLVVPDVELQGIDGEQVAFLNAVLAMFEESGAVKEDSDLLRVNVTNIMRELHLYDGRGTSKERETGLARKDARVEKIRDLIKPWTRCVGMMPDGKSYYTVLNFRGYKSDTDEVEINAPYIYELERYSYEHSSPDKRLHRYIHASAMNENPHALEVANRIAASLARRGSGRKGTVEVSTQKTNKDGSTTTTVLNYDNKEDVVEVTIRYRTIIEDCPELKERLAEIKAAHGKSWSRDYNNALRNAFGGAWRIIETKSDIPVIFEGLTVDGKTIRKGSYAIPTRTAVEGNHKLDIKFTGKRQPLR